MYGCDYVLFAFVSRLLREEEAGGSGGRGGGGGGARATNPKVCREIRPDLAWEEPRALQGVWQISSHFSVPITFQLPSAESVMKSFSFFTHEVDALVVSLIACSCTRDALTEDILSPSQALRQPSDSSVSAIAAIKSQT